MRYSPKTGGRRVVVPAVLLFAAAIVCFIVPSTPAASRVLPASIVQTVGMLFAVAGIYVLVRYKFIVFTYVISLRDSGADPEAAEAYAGCDDVTRVPRELLDFTVWKKQGSRPGAAECILSLGDLERARKFPEKRGLSRAAREEFGASEYYDFTSTPRATDVTLLLFSDGGKAVAIAVECDDVMSDFLIAVSGKR